MKKPVPYFPAFGLIAAFLAFNPTTSEAGGVSIRIGDGHHDHHAHSSGHRGHHGSGITFSRGRGAISSSGIRHRLSGHHRFHLNTTRFGHGVKRFHHPSFHDRDRHHRLRGRGHDHHRFQGSKHHDHKLGHKRGSRNAHHRSRFRHYRLDLH